MENHKTAIRCGRVDIHRDQAIVERFNRTLANACLAISVLCISVLWQVWQETRRSNQRKGRVQTFNNNSRTVGLDE